LRASESLKAGMFAPISREGALVLNNLFLTTAAATVLVGTLYPLLLESVTGTKISVGPPFFNLTFGPLMIPLLLAVPFGPLLAWKRADLAGAAHRLYFAIGISLMVGLGVVFLQTGAPVLAGLGIALGVFLILGSLTDLALRSGIGRVATGVAWSRLIGLPRSAFGTAFAIWA
jgi:cytochrome c-type biogenesis protein CcmF